MARLAAVETQLPPDPIALAERVWSGERPALLWSADASGPSYLACDPVESSDQLDPEPLLPSLAHPDFDGTAGGALWAHVPRWIGVLPYESERRRLERNSLVPLEVRPAPHRCQPTWNRYGAVCVIDRRVTVVGESSEHVQALLHRLKRPAPRGLLECGLRPSATEPEQRHIERIRRALELIAAGEIYQVNLARRLGFEVQGSLLALLYRMARRARPAFGAALDLGAGLGLVSTSPELFLATSRDGRTLTIPIKGTRPRGANAAQDASLRAELAGDPKEIAELAMVIDVERNDLGRVARIGSVHTAPPAVIRHASVFHRQARVSCLLRDGVTRSELLQAMLPSGSITGAPKVRAMEVIAELESARRGAYTGALGYLSQGGQLRLAMAIRCLSVRESIGHYHVGGGIVADSSPERELIETRWKSAQITARLVDFPE